MSLNRGDRSRAVLIGTATYKGSSFPPVPAAANSLHGFRAALADPALCGWSDDQLTVICDESDPAVVVKQLREFATETTGVLLVYFVGHGTITSDGKLCLALTGTDATHPDITGLEYDRVRRALLNSPARIKIVILDCCYSGRAIEALGAADDIADIADIHGAYALTASDQAAVVPRLGEQAKACTSFTGELLQLIREGVPGAPPQLTFALLYPHLRQRLRDRGLPDPNQRGTDNAGNYPFTRNAACPGQSAAVPDPGYGPTGAALPAGRSAGGRRQAVGRRTMVLGGLAAATSAAVPTALILSRPAPSSPARPPAAEIVTDHVQLQGHTKAVHAVAFRPHHGTTLASGSEDGTIRLWDTASATPIDKFPGSASVGEIAFSPDGAILASGSDLDPTARLWEMTTKRASPLPGLVDRVFSVAFSRDGTTLASGSPGPGHPGYQVQLWDVASVGTRGFFAEFPVHAVAFGEDSHILAFAGNGGDYNVQLWDLSARKRTTALHGHTSVVNSVVFSPDGKTLASASDDKTVRLWDVSTGGNIAVLPGHTNSVASVAFSPDGKTLASGSKDYTARLWDRATKRATVIFSGHQYWVNSVAFSADGRTLATGSYDKTIGLWQIP